MDVRIIRVNQSMNSTNSNSPGDSEPPLRIEHQYDNETPPSIAIVRAIAVIENVPPMNSTTDLGVRLYDHIDPTALDQLVDTENDGVDVTIDFTIQNGHQYAVQVQDTGRLVVEKTA